MSEPRRGNSTHRNRRGRQCRCRRLSARPGVCTIVAAEDVRLQARGRRDSRARRCRSPTCVGLTARCRESLVLGPARRGSFARFSKPATRRPSNARSNESDRRADIERRRQLRRALPQPGRSPSRALGSPPSADPRSQQYSRRPADALRMERRLSDGPGDCRGLPGARLSLRRRHRSLVRAEDRRRDVDGRSGRAAAGHRRRQRRCGHHFRLLQGIEANIDAAASWISPTTRPPRSMWSWPRRTRGCEGPRTRPTACWRRSQHPAVRILAHPRGRITGSRAGVVADWDAVFASAAHEASRSKSMAIPHARTSITRWPPAHSRRAASSRSTATRIPRRNSSYAETAVAHARLAGIPADRIVNCWPLDRLLAWLRDPRVGCRR